VAIDSRAKDSSTADSAIILVVDRLGAGHLGPYGNTWLPTPHFNRLAAESLVCETVLADSPDLCTALRTYWTGRHALEPPADANRSLPQRAASGGVASLLITDEPLVAEHPLAGAFSERVLVESPRADAQARQVEQTGLLRLIAAALDAIDRRPAPFLAWIHSRGMAGPWDAPGEFRERLADPEDPAPPSFVLPPERRLGRDYDPDEVLGAVQAYGSQVQLLDECLGVLLDALDQRPDQSELLTAVTSPRGYPLGEHGRIGACDEALYSELTQVPLVVRFPRGEGRLMRTQRLVQNCDLARAIVEACGWGEWDSGGFAISLLGMVQGREMTARDIAVATAPNQRLIRTPAWQLRDVREGEDVLRELFTKPDDRWEANEVSSRAGDVAALLAAELDRFEDAARTGRLAELAPPAETLLDVWR
jgi:arylsulfatase A-like enzyme